MQYQLNSNDVVSDTIDGEVLAIRSDSGAHYSMRGTTATAVAEHRDATIETTRNRIMRALLPFDPIHEVQPSGWPARTAEPE